MIHHIAEIDSAAIGLFMQGIGAIASIVLACVLLFRTASGKDGERQIEPTAIHAITSELKNQTITLNKLDREMGETKASIRAVDEKVTRQGDEVANAFRRINAISTESAGTSARVDGLELREAARKTI